MQYYIDDKEIYENYGAVGSPAGAWYALSGQYDIPARKEPYCHEWGSTVEPYDKATDYRAWERRKLTLSLWVGGNSLTDYDTKLSALLAAIKAAASIRQDWTEGAVTKSITWAVHCLGAASVEEHRGVWCATVVAEFTATVAWKPAAITATAGSGTPAIDGYPLSNLGIGCVKFVGLNHLGEAVTEDDTPANIASRKPSEITMNAVMRASTLSELISNLDQFAAITQAATASGKHVLTTQKGSFSGFYPDGCEFTLTYATWAEIALKMRITEE